VTILKRISLLLALGACLAAAGCGADDEKGKPIPADTAAALERQLDGVQARLDNGSAGACQDILEGTRGPNRDAVQQLLDGLPNDVDPDVRDALEQSFNNLWSLVESKCQDLQPDQPTQTQTQTQTQPEPETDTTETQTETTETTPPETDTETNPDEGTLPPDGDGESDGAIPDTGGNSGGAGPGISKAKKGKVSQ
jgi:hypothetical protein